MTTSFQDDWGFPSDVKATIPGAAYYDIRPTPDATFKTGRPKFECAFLDVRRNVLERRDAMELISKRTGSPYHVVRRQAAQAQRRQAVVPAAQAQDYSDCDVFE